MDAKASPVIWRSIGGATDGPPRSIRLLDRMGIAMRLETTRFGAIDVDSESILLFPNGLLGFEAHRHWILLAESDTESVGWLQSLNDVAVSIAVVTPQAFVPQYALRIHRSHLTSLPWAPGDEALVLAVVSEHEGEFTLNLRAPLLLNLRRGLGQQVITADEQPVRFVLSSQPSFMRKSA